MKAFKYHRFCDGPRFSMQSLSISETIIYVPEIKRILYSGYDGYHMKTYFGVCVQNSEVENMLLTEAEAYVADVKGGIIKAQLPEEESKELPSTLNPDNNIYAVVTTSKEGTVETPAKKASQQKFYIKKISAPKEEEPIPPAGEYKVSMIANPLKKDLYLYELEELDLEITLEEMQKIEQNEILVKKIESEKEAFKTKIFK